jgi:hypothetical protein
LEIGPKKSHVFGLKSDQHLLLPGNSKSAFVANATVATSFARLGLGESWRHLELQTLEYGKKIGTPESTGESCDFPWNIMKDGHKLRMLIWVGGMPHFQTQTLRLVCSITCRW